MDLIPEDHAILLRIGLGSTRHLTAPFMPGQVEGVAHDALDRATRIDAGLHGNLAGLARPDAPAHPGILPFRIFAYTDEVDILRAAASQRPDGTGEQTDRALVDVQIEALADRQKHAPETYVVRHGGKADRAKVDRVEFLERLERVGRHHPAMLEVVGTAPVERRRFQPEIAAQLGQQRQRLQAFRDNVLPDAIARKHRHPMIAHRHSSFCRSSATLGMLPHVRRSERMSLYGACRSRRACISSGVKPSSWRISSVCCPSTGGAERIVQGVPPIR